MSKVLGGVWVTSRMCGCGECRFKPASYVCPMGDDKGALKLWASDFSRNKVNVPEEDKPEKEIKSLKNKREFIPTDVMFQKSGQEATLVVHG